MKTVSITILILISVITTESYEINSESHQEAVSKAKRSLILEKSQAIELIRGTPDLEKDMLLINTTITKERESDKLVFSDFAFNESLYPKEYLKDESCCPVNITAIMITPLDSPEKSAYPFILFGGVGDPECTFLFISKKNEGINFSVKIWGRPAELQNKKPNLIEGIPSVEDEFLGVRHLEVPGKMYESTYATVYFEAPAGYKITSFQAWDESKGCKSGGFPEILDGGIGYSHLRLKVTSESNRGVRYVLMAYGTKQKY